METLDVFQNDPVGGGKFVAPGGYLEVDCGAGKGFPDLAGALDVGPRLHLASWGEGLHR